MNKENQTLEESLKDTGDGLVDTASSILKQGIGILATSVNGAKGLLDGSLNITSAAINDVTIPTVAKLKGMAITSTKSVVGLGYDTVKDVGNEVVNSGKTVFNEVKSMIPQSVKANVTEAQAPAPASAAEKLAFIAKSKTEAIATIRAAEEAERAVREEANQS